MKKSLLSGLVGVALSCHGATNSLVSSNTVYNMIQLYGASASNATTNNNTLLSGYLLGGNGAKGATNVAVGTGLSLSGGVLTAPGGGLAVGDLSVTNYIPRLLVSDATSQDPYRWMNLTNGLLRFPSWSSDRIVGSLTPGIHFYSITNGVDQFSIDVQQDHAAGGVSEARMIALWDMAIVPGYNKRIQLGASTDNYNQSVDIQYANPMGWSHLLSLAGNTNGNIGSFSLQNRRISTTTNLNDLYLFATAPTWNTYPTPGFSNNGLLLGKLSINGSYFYSDLWGPRIIATNRIQAGSGTQFGSTPGALEVTGGYSDSIILGGDFAADTRTDGVNKYGWISSVTKTFSNARPNLFSWVIDSSTTSTLNIGGGTSVHAPLNHVKIYAGANSTVAGNGSLGIDVSNGLVTTTNLLASLYTGDGTGITNASGFRTNGAVASAWTSSDTYTYSSNVVISGSFIVKSNSYLSSPTLAEGDNWYFSSNGIPHVRYLVGGVTTTVRLVP